MVAKTTKKNFKDRDKIKTLLWSDRHCCLCGKSCGMNIEVHHIDPQGGNNIDNAIPLCFDCHAAVQSYNKEHPRGTKYHVEELKARREQIYEEYTRHLVPPLSYRVTQRLPNGGMRKLPNVGFIVSHLEDYLPVRLKVLVNVFLNSRDLGPPDPPTGHYSGNRIWNLNPQHRFSGHFNIPQATVNFDRLAVKITVTIIDLYEREHELLPVGYIYMERENDWYFEPCLMKL